MIDTILFDLDGTLLPMNQDDFMTAYFEEVAKKFVPQGYDKDELIQAIWSGTKSMIQNDGKKTNREVFWLEFGAIMGEEKLKDEKYFDEFYTKEFNNVKRKVKDDGISGILVKELKEKNYKLILATSPLFPLVAVETRLRWIGLEPEDFSYITSYENCRYCKPGADYYREIIKNTGITAENSIMVGNNVDEDMTAAETGMETFLVTSFIENKNDKDISAFKHGTLIDFREYIL